MILAFTGYKHCGKSTAAKYLEDKHGFTRLNFKDALIKEMKQTLPDVLLGLSDTYEMTIDELFEKKPPLMRALLQNYGTDVRRNDRESYWTDEWGISYSKLHPNNVVCDDLRFLNEAETIRKYGGTIIRINRNDIINTDTHQSETEMDSIKHDYLIEAVVGDHQALYDQTEWILSCEMSTMSR